MIHLRMIAIVSLAVCSNAGLHNARRLSTEPIAGYKPQTLVTSHNAIDLDQREIELHLLTESAQGIWSALALYKEGAHSDPVAQLRLDEPLTKPLSIGEVVIGLTPGDQASVKGIVADNYPETTTTHIEVEYDILPVQEEYVNCQVGASATPNTEGCFKGEGRLVVSGFDRGLAYSYDIGQNNKNRRTIKGFSVDAAAKMAFCDACPYEDYDKFYKYYGKYDYADKWILAAAEATETKFLNGNANFKDYSALGISQAIKTATVLMNIWMYVIREMEDALDDCAATPSLGVHAWDEAVAFYTGSLEGQSGSGDGVLLYAWADKLCLSMKTCGLNGDSLVSTSSVNRAIFDEFRAGQAKLQDKDCPGARENKESIVALMTVPLIQGTLRFAHMQFFGTDTGEKAEAQGAIFAAAVLPMVHSCGGTGEADATVIYENLKVGHEEINFSAVKKAFERNYKCLGISCADVGGIWNSAQNEYHAGAAPCGGGKDKSSSRSGGQTAGLAIGVALGGVGFILLIVLASQFCGKKAAPMPSEDTPASSAELL